MFIDFLKTVFAAHPTDDAIIWKDQAWSFGWLLERLTHWENWLRTEGVASGQVVAIEADFSPNAVALFLSLIEAGTIVVPLTDEARSKRDEFLALAQTETFIRIDRDDQVSIERLPGKAEHPMFQELRGRGHPGLVLFSSGSTGKSKAAVHDLLYLLEKFKVAKRRLRAISFLMYDHIGGVNSMLYMLSNAGCLVTVSRRDPDTVLEAIAKHRVELLPTTPTFLNLILLSEAYKRHDLSSLTTVTYGTEPMPESTLRRFHELFPHLTLQQTYGLSEIGIPRSKSRSSDSLWVKIGGEGFETRVVDGMLQIKAQSAMLGYLNAPSPFTDDGWFMTGDAVEQDGEYLRILGRRSELINVGGQKVFPAEVETVLLDMDNVRDVVVTAVANPITGHAVAARFELERPEELRSLRQRVREHCRDRLQSYKIPVKVEIADGPLYGNRLKKVRTIS
jgi:acyl-coenzyme A synthetase/AMP-(fatty) acid ligase